VLIPFSSGSVQIFQDVYAAAGCFSPNQGTSCSETTHFMNTALIGGVTVLDVNVNPAPGATVASESGWDYTQQIVSAQSPQRSA
jgi:hypothetical protein